MPLKHRLLSLLAAAALALGGAAHADSLTGKSPKDTYRDLLQMSNSNAGFDTTLRPVMDGKGTAGCFQLSTLGVRFTCPVDFSGNSFAGLTLNRLSATQRDAIASPLSGSVIFNTTAGQLEVYDGTGWVAYNTTASNVGTAGTGVFKQKSGADLQFKKLNAASSRLTVTDDTANSKIDLDVSEANLVLSSMSGVLGVVHGGTGATSASAARTALGLGIGADVQAYDTDLDALSALSGTGLAARTASNTWANRSFAAGSNKISVTNGDGVAGNPTIDVTEANLTHANIGGSIDLGGAKASGTLAAARFPALTGDVSTAAGSLTTSIGAGVVTNSMLAGSIDLTSKVTGTLPIANGGTGQTSASGAINALLPSQSSNSGKYLTSNGTAASWGDLTVPSVAFASLPSAASSAGKMYFVNDIGTGCNFVSTGTIWKPAGGVCVLGAGATGYSVTGTASETQLASVPVPAGLMTANGQLRITTLWTVPNNANTKTLRVRFGGSGGTVYMNNALTTTATMQAMQVIRNRGAANSQVGFNASQTTQLNTATSAVATSATDTSAATSVYVSGQLGTTTDTITLEAYSVELLIP